MMYIKVYTFMESNKHLHGKKIGFRASHSTNYALNLSENYLVQNKEFVVSLLILRKPLILLIIQLCDKLNYYGF